MSKYYDKLLAERQTAVQMEQHHREHGAVYDAVIEQMPNVIHIQPYSNDCTVGIAGSKLDLEAAWGALRRTGFEFDGHMERPKKGDNSWYGEFHNGKGASIWLSFTSTQCRRVKTGVKLVEVDTYETVCDEQEFPA